MLKNIDQGTYVDMGVGIFFRGGALGDFSNIFIGGQKWKNLLFSSRN